MTSWRDKRGFGRFTRELVQQLVHDFTPAHQFFLVADPATAAEATLPASAQVVVAGTRRRASETSSADDWRSPLDLLRLGWRAGRCGADVFFFPSPSSFYPVLGRVPVVVAVHDTMTEDRPELFFPDRRARLFWTAKMRLLQRQASTIVTPSESARQRVAAAMPRPAGTVVRIDEAPAAVFHSPQHASEVRAVRSTYGLPANIPLVLFVGGIDRHKNLGNLLLAMSSVAPGDPAAWHLVIVGAIRVDRPTAYYTELVATRGLLGLTERVTFTGFVPDEDLASLYHAARMLVLPSLDEGFGLPVVEAMACGLPVAVSARGALPDLVGEAGLVFDPENSSDMARTIARLLGDDELHQTLGARGVLRAATFTWRQSARQLMAVFEATAAR